MGGLSSWTQSTIIAAVVLLSPVLAFIVGILVEILLGLMKEAGAPAALAIILAGVVVSMLVRKFRMRPGNSASAES
jgi:hypothetical protein